MVITKNYFQVFLLSIQELFFKMRISIFQGLVRIFSKYLFTNSNFFKKLNFSLKEIEENGFVKLDNYYSQIEINFINNISKIATTELINNNFDKNFLDTEKKSGSIKIKNLSKQYKEIQKFSYDFFLLFLSFIFNFRVTKPVEILNYSHDGNGNDIPVEGKCVENIAGTPHRDIKNGKKHYLKAVILLKDVNKSNGPTKLIPNTNSLIKFGNKEDFNSEEDFFGKLVKKNGIRSFEGKCGDLIIFDSTNIHWASKFDKGERKLIWLYF